VTQKNILKINNSFYDSLTDELISGPKIEKTVVEARIKQAREQARHLNAHKRQQSKTLMRKAVKKPSNTQKTTNFNKSLPIAKQNTLQKKLSAQSINETRLHSAARTLKHDKVSKFSPVASNYQQPTPIQNELPPKKLKKQPRTTEDLLMHAIARANAHENTYEPNNQRSFKILGTKTSLIVAGIAIIAILAVSLVPHAELKIASNKAGFNIAKPSYRPAGFSLQKINSDAGNASLVYKSNSDDRKFTINEKLSNWNNETLSGVLAASTDSNQIVTPGGYNVFIDSNGNATWMNNGVQYEIYSKGTLSNRQITQIVDSL
jgi:hypothetical protein